MNDFVSATIGVGGIVIAVNLDNVISMAPTASGGTRIHLVGGGEHRVKESIDELLGDRLAD